MKNEKENKIKIFCAKDWHDYELLDTGEGEKLERFGPYTFVRPYEGAVWKKTLGEKEWSKTDGKFWSSKVGAKAGWKFKNPEGNPWGNSLKGYPRDFKWEMSYKGIKFLVSPTPFRHLGFFPEQASHWDFIEEKIEKRINSPLEEYPKGEVNEFSTPSRKRATPQEGNLRIRFLNLFGYTGVASLFALRAGAEVTHIDASKISTEWAKENQKIFGLEKMPMRIICEDVMKFLERETKRGNKYDAVIMDPPKFGRGPKGETWEIEKDLPKLLSQVRKILSDKPLFVILNSYAIDSSSLSLGYALENAMIGLKGEVSSGELCLPEKSNGRNISLSNTAIFC
ncbi:MAG: class I SAM-dependent methyltransferase [Candidatus Nomurabacteria bacterium]|nr:class I SAM-dependent methyltransferase [Candidatus Nomurabacteria bacterium]